MFYFSLARTCRGLLAGLLATACLPALAATFTNNTTIVSDNTNFDGTAIVVSNCTLALEGAHTFSSLHVAAGGVLTHLSSSSGSLPGLIYITNEVQVLSGTNPVSLLNPNVYAPTIVVTDPTGTIDYTYGVDYLDFSTNGGLTDIERTTNSSIPSGGIVLVTYGATTPSAVAGLFLTVTGNVEVDTGGSINANGIGYGGAAGPGAGGSAGGPQDGSGGGYGGNGGYSSSNAVGGTTYGSFYQPASLGSGGGTSYAGPGGAGGGLIEIVAGGSVTVNGVISANGGNGTNSRSGGGSGGSVWITAVGFSGTGSIAANGGNGDPGHGGGGGGGRISVQYTASSFVGTTTAYGGTGANIGGAGDIYTKVSGQNGILLFDNGGQVGTNSSVTVSDTTINVIIQGEAEVTPANTWSVGNLTINSNGLIVAGSLGTMSVTSSGSITVEEGGVMQANAVAGASGGVGVGRTYGSYPWPCGGGGYGGAGANSPTNATGGVTYGSQSGPSGLGSGGGTYSPYSFGGNGGGQIQLTCSGGIIQVDGTISANGGNGSGAGGGGGSGGTITLTAGTLLGAGSITVNGGNGANSIGGGGGGGRMVISASANLFAGAFSAYGGGGGNWGGAGTILLEVTGQTYQLILDNDGNTGTNTLLQSQSNPTDLIVRNGAAGSATASVTFDDLYLDFNGWLVPAANTVAPAYTMTFAFTGNATIEPGGGIIADFAGNPGNEGSGEGHASEFNDIFYCSGAGHGGYGGNSFGNYAAGGVSYDTMTSPSQPGSGGGMYSGQSVGGPGGGVVHLTVTGTLEVDGIISANGGNGSNFGGGGSGGSIYISAGTLAGAGSIAVNGGTGSDALGGGGSGGMTYISCTNNSFAGTMTAYGGAGANWGGEGTAIVAVSGKNSLLILDGGGHSGPPTPLPSSSTIDVTMRNGAIATPTYSTTVGNLLISSNAWLMVSNAYSYYTLTATSATIQAGGGIIGDAMGGAAGSGLEPGHAYTSSLSYPCSGAGHGGNGGSCISNLAGGGTAYDSPTAPFDSGSGGGTYSPYSTGGAGGSGFGMTVTGLLQVDGSISANGGNGSGSGGGGGSGGGISLTAGTLAGAGSITANGGSGANLIGGGGAGGCIAIFPTVNQFAGTISAYGGGGANVGGAGTIYISTNGSGQLILDNAAQLGNTTPLSISSSSTSLIVRNGAMALASSTGLTLGNVVINSNAWMLVSNYGGYSITLSFSSATIQPGGGIMGNGLGSLPGQGTRPGQAYSGSASYPCSGAGHGGNGGSCISNIVGGGVGGYDYLTSPSSAGSGGGTFSPYSAGGAGGAQMHLTVTGLLQLDGAISANGGNGSGLGGGGGSGGTINLTIGTLAGGGSITANGGSGANLVGGGGGGGCIAISPTVNQFAGTISAYGGGGANPGGAGTIYIATNSVGQLTLDNAQQSGTTPLQSESSSVSLLVRNGATALISSGVTFGNVTINSNAWMLVSNLTETIMTFSSATIQAGGGLIADFQGYTAGLGSGEGHPYEVSPSYPCSGAGHGGNGGACAGNYEPGGVAYDTQSSPNIAGSGGGTEAPYSVGGTGGGIMHLAVTGLLQVDGRISASGAPGTGLGGGGGSGGGIYLTAGTLAGAGSISANGGSGANGIGGGGAGGCIAIFPTANEFDGTISAYGGAGANVGGAGTIYSETGGQSSSTQLIVDNGGQSGTNTPIQPVSSSATVILRNGGVGYQLATPQTFASLLINSNGSLTAIPVSGSVNLTVTGNATIQAGGAIITDSAGYAANNGNGAGRYNGSLPNYPCSGAGYGGNGGASLGNAAMGGLAYGSIVSPSANGSGGGGFSQDSIGGAGGGYVRLTVNGSLDVEGKISANGGNGSGVGGGGGSGGSISLTLGTLVGAGAITANGGYGAGANGGGGGGGRIAMTYSADDFSGNISANGGGGYAYGGAGTIYTKANSQSIGQLTLANGGQTGALTPVSTSLGTPSQLFNLTVGNGASIAPPATIPQLNNLTIASGGQLIAASSLSTLDLLVFGNVDVQPGGAIIVDGQGYPQGGGPGAGQSVDADGSGAGYGGAGGASAAVAGGASYGSSTQPTNFGSGGGFGEGPSAGGSAGGGALRLSVGGALTVDGHITANGQPGVQDNSGGGSGGSICLTAGILSGSGLITAGGGEADLYDGGGGAGGRIAVYGASIFDGSITAPGGEGYLSGSAGSIYSNAIPTLEVLSSSPTGIVTNAVSSVMLYFNDAPNPNSISSSAVSLTTPNGPLPASSLSVSMQSSVSYLVTFPAQTGVGSYVLNVSSNIIDLYGQPMAQAYTGTFTVSLPVIQGTITDTNGNPIAGVLLQATDGLSSTTTDTNGNYSLGFVPGSSFTVTPSLGTLVFLPPSMSYTNALASIPSQNYLAVPSIAASLASAVSGTNIVLSWQGINGVNYQLLWSTNLINWAPYSGPWPGSNGPMQTSVPITMAPEEYFQLQSSN